MKLHELQGQDKKHFNDVALIQNISLATTKSGSTYGQGKLSTTEIANVPYKIWDGEMAETIKQALENGSGNVMIVNIGGDTNVYNGSFQAVIRDVGNAPDANPQDFLQSDYDVTDLMKRLTSTYGPNISKSALNIIAKVLNGELAKSFANSISAVSHHDAQLHGLLAHTTKIEEFIPIMIKNYPDVFYNQDIIDIFYMGMLFHDLGKTVEYSGFGMSDIGFLGHRYLGVRIIEQYHDLIADTYGEMGYDYLLSIILQHHGVYEERPKTVLAYMAHLVDAFEANLTDVNEHVKSAKETKTDDVFQYATDGSRLRLKIWDTDKRDTTTGEQFIHEDH